MPDQARKRFWRHPSLATAVVFAAVAGWVWWYSGRFPPGMGAILSPAFYPRLAAAAMLGLAGLLAILAVLGMEHIDWRGISRAEMARWSMVIGLMAAYIVVWSRSRYEVATVLFGASFVYVFERCSLWRALLFAGLLTAAMWLLFAWGLRVPLEVVKASCGLA